MRRKDWSAEEGDGSDNFTLYMILDFLIRRERESGSARHLGFESLARLAPRFEAG